MSVKTYNWIEDNSPLILDIYLSVNKAESEIMSNYDDVFRDAIRDNTKNLLYSMVCIEHSRCTGESTEEFYAMVDVDELYDFVVRLKDYSGDAQ